MKINHLKKGRPRVLVKIGGSLIKKGHAALFRLSQTLASLNKEYRIIILPGGGEVADVVRKLYKTCNLSQDTAHWMAILAMNINGILLTGVHPRLKATDSIAECNKLLNLDYIPVFLPYELLKKTDGLPRTWGITSDSITLSISKILKANFVILLKDVDGIYKKNHTTISTIAASKLKTLPQMCVDKYLYKLLPDTKKNLYICSGLHPKRIKKILSNEPTKFTKLLYKD